MSEPSKEIMFLTSRWVCFVEVPYVIMECDDHLLVRHGKQVNVDGDQSFLADFGRTLLVSATNAHQEEEIRDKSRQGVLNDSDYHHFD